MGTSAASKPKANPLNSFLFWTRLVGIIVTTLFVYAVVIDFIREYRAGTDQFYIYVASVFNSYDSYRNPPGLYIIYLGAYAIAWIKPLWGAIGIISISIFGNTVSNYSDVKVSYLLTFIVGLLYLLYWYDKRKRLQKKNMASIH